VLMFNVANREFLAPFVIIFGLTLGAPLVLMPMLTADSMGLRRFGSIAGVTGVCQTIGAAVGPILTGKIYDVTGSYSLAFDLFIVACICGAITTLSVMSLETEQSRLEPVAATA